MVKPMKYALVDNKMNRVWAFEDTIEQAYVTLRSQDDPSFYRIETVLMSDYIGEDGRMYNQKFVERSLA